ncbi:MAG: Cyclic pyranopterin monophosphate synthase [Candidatus Izimaplasma bacterium HR2]|nr:MAG: Cyclic pyranopterin monophosphate synthase [Candidatus Izimaplasma bacterium HR2]
MKDAFKREIDYLRISVTDRCNLRCLYCMPDGIQDKKEHDEIMRDEEIVNVVQESVKIGITKIRITGGEPLLRKGIYDLIRKIKDVKGIKEITITTNAILLVGNVKKLKDAGVSRVNFSLDTLDSEKFKFISNTSLTLDYISLIEELIEHDLQPIKVNAVLLKGFNDSEIPGFIELANKYDISIRLIELMTVGHLNFDYDKYYISKDEILKRYKELKFVRKDSVSEYYNVEGNKGYIGFINPISHKFCSDCNRIRLTADGHLKPCLHNNNEILIKEIQGEPLLNKLREAIHAKPISHTLDESKDNRSDRPMNKIGG